MSTHNICFAAKITKRFTLNYYLSFTLPRDMDISSKMGGLKGHFTLGEVMILLMF